jgi:hypothetical protein
MNVDYEMDNVTGDAADAKDTTSQTRLVRNLVRLKLIRDVKDLAVWRGALIRVCITHHIACIMCGLSEC